MTDQIAIVADMRPAQRAALERIVHEGPPFDLATRSLLGAFVKMSSVVSAPRILEQTFQWDRRAERA